MSLHRDLESFVFCLLAQNDQHEKYLDYVSTRGSQSSPRFRSDSTYQSRSVKTALSSFWESESSPSSSQLAELGQNLAPVARSPPRHITRLFAMPHTRQCAVCLLPRNFGIQLPIVLLLQRDRRYFAHPRRHRKFTTG